MPSTTQIHHGSRRRSAVWPLAAWAQRLRRVSVLMASSGGESSVAWTRPDALRHKRQSGLQILIEHESSDHRPFAEFFTQAINGVLGIGSPAIDEITGVGLLGFA